MRAESPGASLTNIAWASLCGNEIEKGEIVEDHRGVMISRREGYFRNSAQSRMNRMACYAFRIDARSVYGRDLQRDTAACGIERKRQGNASSSSH
jgi:hypothetical protein